VTELVYKNTLIHFFDYNKRPLLYGYSIDDFKLGADSSSEKMRDPNINLSQAKHDTWAFAYDHPASILSNLFSLIGDFTFDDKRLSIKGTLLLGYYQSKNSLVSIRTSKNFEFEIPIQNLEWDFIPIYAKYPYKIIKYRNKYGKWLLTTRIGYIKNFKGIMESAYDKIIPPWNLFTLSPSQRWHPDAYVSIPTAVYFHVFLNSWGINLGVFFTDFNKKGESIWIKPPKSFISYLKNKSKELRTNSKNTLKALKRDKKLLENCIYCQNKILIKNKLLYFCENCGWISFIENEKYERKEIDTELIKKFLFILNFKIIRRNLHIKIAELLFKVFSDSQKGKSFFRKKVLKYSPLSITFFPMLDYLHDHVDEIFEIVEKRIDNRISDIEISNLIEKYTTEIFKMVEMSELSYIPKEIPLKFLTK